MKIAKICSNAAIEIIDHLYENNAIESKDELYNAVFDFSVDPYRQSLLLDRLVEYEPDLTDNAVEFRKDYL